MKQITLQVPDDKFYFIIELLNQLGIKDVHENDLYIPELHKNIIRDRLQNNKMENSLNLRQFETHMKAKYGV